MMLALHGTKHIDSYPGRRILRSMLGGDEAIGFYIMKTKFIFSIDVETRVSGDPEQDIMGALPGYGEKMGVEKIMDLLEAWEVHGTFFLNVYEVAKYGEEIIASAARLIHARGHDLELHTHPRPMYEFYGMSRAPLGEQIGILEKGMSLIEGWTGKRVIAHRAGAFSANADTLRAVEAAGLLLDSSLSPGSRVLSSLVKELGASNLARYVGKVWEIPVTYYDQLRIGSWCSRRILDIEGCSLSEIKHVTRWAIQQGVPTVCILMHSFSLSRDGRPDRRVIGRLSALLAWLREQNDIEFGTIEQVCQHLDVCDMPQVRVRAANTGFWLTWSRALRSWNDGWKNLLVTITGISCFALLALVLVYFGYAILKD